MTSDLLTETSQNNKLQVKNKTSITNVCVIAVYYFQHNQTDWEEDCQKVVFVNNVGFVIAQITQFTQHW